jgi:L-2-hydroxyglutarate oxidase
MKYDYCIIGGGIVGLATALAILRRCPGASLTLLEKENTLASHQTGHNSGVIHAGVYYAPGSLKADLCRRGAEATKAFCQEHGIPFDVCGKLVVATDERELSRMEALYSRSQQNGLSVRRLDASELAELEPNIVGKGALLVETTGIADYKAMCSKMADLLRIAGADIRLGVRVTAIRERGDQVELGYDGGSIVTDRLIACAGLQSDRLARLAGVPIDHQIIPFRGEYFRLPASRASLIRHLIYPVPDPDLPFLGVHLTRMIDGGITVGPNAVLGFAREGYSKSAANVADMLDFARFPGFWKVMGKHFNSGMIEMKNSLWKRGYLEQCRKYCPQLTIDDLLPSEAGIRAQAVMRDGTLVHDFLFAETSRMLHVCNAPSPAATSALPIGEMIAARLGAQ